MDMYTEGKRRNNLKIDTRVFVFKNEKADVFILNEVFKFCFLCVCVCEYLKQKKNLSFVIFFF